MENLEEVREIPQRRRKYDITTDFEMGYEGAVVSGDFGEAG
jgi:hypothetical protein